MPTPTDRAAIRDVADTALWVAALRAVESERHDAIFKDDLARGLAGDRGFAIARSIPRSAVTAWGVILRTSAIDRLVVDLAPGVDAVVNLGAGLDTRPYRLSVPPDLSWIEIDLPHLVQQKDQAMQSNKPYCRLERHGVDLNDREARNALLGRFDARYGNILVISEGVIPYLSNSAAASLAEDLCAYPSVRTWIQDFDNAGERKTPRSWAALFSAAPFRFSVSDWFEFFKKAGWSPKRIISSAEQSEQVGRPFPREFPSGLIWMMIPQTVRERILGASGVVLMERDA